MLDFTNLNETTKEYIDGFSSYTGISSDGTIVETVTIDSNTILSFAKKLNDELYGKSPMVLINELSKTKLTVSEYELIKMLNKAFYERSAFIPTTFINVLDDDASPKERDIILVASESTKELVTAFNMLVKMNGYVFATRSLFLLAYIVNKRL